MSSGTRLPSPGAWLRWCGGLVLVVGLLCAPPGAFADRLDEIVKRGELIWGADLEGGGPFLFPDEKDPDVIIGFEVDIANALAKELGVKAVFKQGQWDTLSKLIDNGTIDIVINGYELTPIRQANYRCSRPYYYYGLQLLSLQGGPIHTWEDLKQPGPNGKWVVGALTGSAAFNYLEQNFAKTVDVRPYPGSTDAMQHVATKVIDATVQDDCVAPFYADRFPTLRFCERPVAGGYYVTLVGKNEDRLGAKIDEAFGKLLTGGELKRIYDKWDLSGRTQFLALRDTTLVPSAKSAAFVDVVYNNLWILIRAAGMTVFLAVVSMPLAIMIGILIAVGRLYGPWPIARLFALYVEVVRGTPLMLQLYAIFFLLPIIGIQVPAIIAAITGLAINYSAYEAEIYRAGLQAIPRGQMEAAISLGMTQGQAIRRVILPQAFRIVIPPVTNDFVALFKDTSVCSVVTVVELTKQYNVLALSTGAFVQLALITAILYMLMSYPLSTFARWSERRLATDR